MGKLSLLGAQRVKALEDILDVKMKAELATVEAIDPIDSKRQALEEFGLLEDYRKAQEHVQAASELLQKVNSITGDGDYATLSTSRKYSSRTPYSKRLHAIENEYKAKKDAIKAEFTRKKQMLWLCETLEEAKAIVGLEDDVDG